MNKPWVLLHHDKPCFFKKKWKVVWTWDESRAMWFEGPEAFNIFLLSRAAENDFRVPYHLTGLRIVRRTWWRRMIWSLKGRWHELMDRRIQAWTYNLSVYLRNLGRP